MTKNEWKFVALPFNTRTKHRSWWVENFLPDLLKAMKAGQAIQIPTKGKKKPAYILKSIWSAAKSQNIKGVHGQVGRGYVTVWIDKKEYESHKATTKTKVVSEPKVSEPKVTKVEKREPDSSNNNEEVAHNMTVIRSSRRNVCSVCLGRGHNKRSCSKVKIEADRYQSDAQRILNAICEKGGMKQESINHLFHGKRTSMHLAKIRSELAASNLIKLEKRGMSLWWLSPDPVNGAS